MTKYIAPPEVCDVCKSPITDKFVDGSLRTYCGQWANVCIPCHEKHGSGLGTGRGQLYQRQGEDFVKIEG